MKRTLFLILGTIASVQLTHAEYYSAPRELADCTGKIEEYIKYPGEKGQFCGVGESKAIKGTGTAPKEVCPQICTANKKFWNGLWGRSKELGSFCVCDGIDLNPQSTKEAEHALQQLREEEKSEIATLRKPDFTFVNNTQAATITVATYPLDMPESAIKAFLVMPARMKDEKEKDKDAAEREKYKATHSATLKPGASETFKDVEAQIISMEDAWKVKRFMIARLPAYMITRHPAYRPAFASTMPPQTKNKDGKPIFDSFTATFEEATQAYPKGSEGTASEMTYRVSFAKK